MLDLPLNKRQAPPRLMPGKKKKNAANKAYNPVGTNLVTSYATQWSPITQNATQRKQTSHRLTVNRIPSCSEVQLRRRIIERSRQDLAACGNSIETRKHTIEKLNSSKDQYERALSTARRLHWLIASRQEENSILLRAASDDTYRGSLIVSSQINDKDETLLQRTEVRDVFALLREECIDLEKAIQVDEESLVKLRLDIDTLEDHLVDTLAQLEAENRFLSVQQRYYGDLSQAINEELEVISVKHRLPDDVMIAIFKAVMESEVKDARLGQQPWSNTPAIDCISRVCRRWRNIAQHTPPLWSYIPALPSADAEIAIRWLEARLSIAASSRYLVTHMSILGSRRWSFDTREPLSLILDAQNLAAKTNPRIELKSFEIIGGPSFPSILDYLWVSVNTTRLLFRRVLPSFSKDTNNLTDLRMFLPLVTSDYLEHLLTSLPHLQSLELVLENDTVPVSIPSRALERIKLPKLSSLIASKVIVDAVLPTWIAVPSLKTLGLVVEIEKESGTATRTLYDCLRSYGTDWPVLHTVILKGMWTESMMNYVRDAFTEALSMVRTLEIEGNGFSSLFEHLAQSTLSLAVVNQLVLRDTDVFSSTIRQFVNARQDASTGSNPIRGLTIAGRNSLDRSLCEEMKERLDNVNVYW